MRRVRFLPVVAGLIVALAVSGCTPGDDAERAEETNLYRLRNTGLLQARRETPEGYSAAAEAFAKALEMRFLPQDLLNLARVYVLAESWEQGVDRWEGAARALERFREAVPPEKWPADLFYLEGLVFKHTGDFEKAADRFREVTRRAPGVTAAWFQLGSALVSLRQYGPAVEALKKALELHPEHSAAHYKIYQAYVRMRRKGEAEEWEKKFLALKEKQGKEDAAGGKVPEGHYEKSRFTRIRLVPLAREDVEPARVPIALEKVEIPDAGVEARAAAFLDVDGDGDPDLLAGGKGGVRVQINRGEEGWFGSDAWKLEVEGVSRALPADYESDGRLDVLLVAGAAGGEAGGKLLLYRGEEGGFERGGEGLVADGVEAARWVDYDHDGDLDVVALERASGTPQDLAARIYRNDGDGTFTAREGLLPGSFGGEKGASYGVAAVDIDRGNDIDLVFPNAKGAAAVYLNLRRGPFRRAEVAELSGHTVLAALDLDNDGDMEIVGAPREGVPLRIAWNVGEPEPGELPELRVETLEDFPSVGETRRMESADLDNDGDLDLLVASSKGLWVLRNTRGGRLEREDSMDLFSFLPEGDYRDVATADIDGDCLLDVAAVRDNGEIALWSNRSSKAYRAVRLVLEGGRDNRHGIGAHVEVFSGRAYQRILVEDPRGAWLGLGTRELDDLDGISILWPNGIAQALLPEDVRPADRCEHRVVQKVGLVVSCPFLYVHDGERYRFLTDVVAIAPIDEWRPPDAEPHRDPEEHVRIPSSMLRPSGGHLRLAITEELRETTYLDRARLLRVRHPRGTLVYTDESTRQGGVEPLEVFVLRAGALRPARVRGGELEDEGAGELRAAGDLTREIDRRYFRAFREGPGQRAGWVEPFRIDIDFPETFRTDAAALFLTGRIAWQDSGVAYSLYQHGRTWEAHRLLCVEADGAVRTGLADVGFPCGMDRTIVVPLSGIARDTTRALRLTATSRLFWDRVALASEVRRTVLPDAGEVEVPLGDGMATLRVEVLPLAAARLAYHGFSRVVGDIERHEHVYDFDDAGVWRDFPIPEGLATRYGPVEELVASPDDRLVVMAPGDGLFLEFDAGAGTGGREAVTYFLRLTGWAKESGFHNSTGRAIGPLPFRAMSSYPEGAGTPPLSEAYRRYLEDYQTRRVRDR